MRHFLFYFFLNVLFFSFFTSVEAESNLLKVVTTEFPPYQIQVKGQVEGLTTEIVRAVISEAGFKAEFNAYPWARSYKIAGREPNTLIYSIVRTPEREKLFKWIGDIAPYNVYFWKLASRKDIKITTMEEAFRYISGGTLDDIKALHLEKVGFVVGKNLELVSDESLNIKKLYAGRIDIMPYDELSFPHRVEMGGHDFSKLNRLIKVEGISHNLSLAASLNTSDSVVKKLSESLEAFKKSEKYKKIQMKFKDPR